VPVARIGVARVAGVGVAVADVGDVDVHETNRRFRTVRSGPSPAETGIPSRGERGPG
jgi:hypothetical protein